LVVNFRISAQLEVLSLQINVAGRQHMLSRQMPKALLMVERQVAEGNVESVVLAEFYFD